MQIKYKMEDFLCPLENSGDMCTGRRGCRANWALFSASGYTNSFENGVTLQHHVQCVEGSCWVTGMHTEKGTEWALSPLCAQSWVHVATLVAFCPEEWALKQI